MEIKTRSKRVRRKHPFRLVLQSSTESPTPILLLPTTIPPIPNPEIRKTQASQAARSQTRESRNTFPKTEWFSLRPSPHPTLRSPKPTCLPSPSKSPTPFPFCPPIRTLIRTQTKTQTRTLIRTLIRTQTHPPPLPNSPLSSLFFTR